MKQLKFEIRLIKEQMDMNKIEMEDLKNQVMILKNKSKGRENVQMILKYLPHLTIFKILICYPKSHTKSGT